MQGLSRTLVLMVGCASWMLGQDPKVEYFVGYSVIETNNHAFHFSEIGSVSGLDFDEQGRGFETAVIGNVSRYFSIVADFSAHLSFDQFPVEFCKHHPCPASETQNATVNPRLFDFLAGPEFKWRNHTRITPFANALFGLGHTPARSRDVLPYFPDRNRQSRIRIGSEYVAGRIRGSAP